MKRLLFVITLLFFTIVSCSKSKPKGVLSESKMTDLMVEVYVLDGYLNTLAIDSSRKLLPVLYQSLFDRFKIDSASFTNNIDYYYGNPIELEKLTANVHKKLTKYERGVMQEDSLRQVHVQDSIHMVHRWTRMAQEAKNLILYVYLDSSTYEFIDNNQAFFAAVPLQVQRHEFYKPSSHVPDVLLEEVEEELQDTPLDSAMTVSVGDTSSVELLMEDKNMELLPKVDTMSNLPNIFRYQRFEIDGLKPKLEK